MIWRLQGDDEPSSASKSLPDSLEQGRAIVVAEMAETVEHHGGAPLVGSVATASGIGAATTVRGDARLVGEMAVASACMRQRRVMR
ncbi:hypothetical protein [uncultured Tessaracoccus sp.]|uniref:hypothetical protein n=1 Tax=uncultured Tessaracoccus sp. TaxID=905023 RepID=UPI00262FEC98|nr:hypothetical protein [uncultured Tessaracoccus sp.]